MKNNSNKLKNNIRGFLRSTAESLKGFFTDYRGYLLTLLTLGSLALSIFYFEFSFQRLKEGFVDFGTSISYYFGYIYGLEFDVSPSVLEFSSYDFENAIWLPFTWEEFLVLWNHYWEVWTTWENVHAYILWLGDFLFYASQILLMISPFFFLLFMLFRRALSTENTDHNKDSKVMKWHRKFTHNVLEPVKVWFRDYLEFIKLHSFWWKSFLLIWLYNFNLLGIAVEFFAFYFFFVASFDFSAIYGQVVKLLVDLSVAIFTIPVFGWVLIGFVVWELIAYKIGYNNLQHSERKDRGFINERSIITFVCGTMGTGKTTAITDMALSESVEFHDKAYKILLDVDFEFFRFPWQNFQEWLKTLFNRHIIYSPYTCKEAVKKIKVYYELSKKYPRQEKTIRRHLKKEFGYKWSIFNPFDYDINHYGGKFWNGVLEVDLWQDLEDYAQAYYIYIISSSLILANYSIRTDERMIDLGNFPIWDSNFFRKERQRVIKSHHAHILDFDMLRLGKKIIENNPNFYAFGVGIYVVSEIDKERQNALSLKEVKASSLDCNEKNDMFNEMLKMVRHATVIRNVPFVHFFVDAQRPEDWGANAREIAEVVHIEDKCEAKVLLPWFSPWRFFEFFYDWIYGKIESVYVDYSVSRGDNIFLIWSLKWLGAVFKHHYERTYNKYGCIVLKLGLENGRLEGDLLSKKYYLCFQKIYKDRFNTAAMAGFFARIAKHAKFGLNDLPEYAETTATDDELAKANSHFYRRIAKYSDMVDDEAAR